MALFATILTQFKKLFLVLLSVLKKPFCCRKRNRRNSGLLLPMTVDKQKGVNQFSGYPVNTNSSNSSANNWPQNQQNSENNTNLVKSNVSSNKNKFNLNALNALIPNYNNSNDVEANEQDIDFFTDMIPQFKKPKKIVLATDQSSDSHHSNRFGVDSKATIFQTKELGVIDHFEDGNSSWEDTAAIEEMWDTDQTLKHMRQQEREKKIAEHQRIKMEKEFKRTKQPKGNLLATKIS